MGWRGVLRSAVAASRAIERTRTRQANATARAHNQIDRIVDRLDREIGRDLERVQAIEAKIVAKPLTSSGVVYDPEADIWTFKALGDDTGQLKWQLTIRFGSDAMTASAPVEDNGRSYQLIALSATRWTVFAAFRITVQSGIARSTKLFNKSNPIANRVLLVINGKAYRSIEGQLDLEIPDFTSVVALAAFPLPSDSAGEVSIDFLFKGGLARIVLANQKPELFTEAAQQASLVEAVRQQFSEHTAPLYQKANETKAELVRSASSSAWVVALIVLAVIVLAIAFGGS